MPIMIDFIKFVQLMPNKNDHFASRFTFGRCLMPLLELKTYQQMETPKGNVENVLVDLRVRTRLGSPSITDAL